MNRRGFLTIAVLPILSGCLEWGDPPDVRLGWVRVSNGHGVEDSHEVTVTVTEEEETVFAETYTVDPEPTYDTVHEQAPLDRPSAYVVRATTADGSGTAIDTTEHVEAEGSCLGVHFEVTADGGVDGWTRSKCEQ